MIDLLIVGQGPAGWSCAITARMRNLSVLVIGPRYDKSALSYAHKIDNYPGMYQASGQEMLQIFRNQAMNLGADERHGLVRAIQTIQNHFMALVDNDVIEAKAVVLATGAAKQAVLPGQTKLLGRGISYCATCDGMFYRGKRVAVLSESEQGLAEAAFLKRLKCEVTYYSLKTHNTSQLDCEIRIAENKVIGFEKGISGIDVKTNDGNHQYDGVFIFHNQLPSQMLLPKLQIKDNCIAVDRHMRTNLPGVYAAGDCTGKPLQVAKAIGEGNIAALSAAQYITK